MPLFPAFQTCVVVFVMESIIQTLVDHYLPNMHPDEFFVDIEFYLNHVVRVEYMDIALENLENLLA